MQELEAYSARLSNALPLNSWRGRVGVALSCASAAFVIGFLGETFGVSAQTTAPLIMLVAGIPVLSSVSAVRMMHRNQSESLRIALVPVSSGLLKDCVDLQ